MSFLQRLLGSGRDDTAAAPRETETSRLVRAQLASMPPARARYLAGFAYVLGRVAQADEDLRPEETQAMRSILERLGHLDAATAALVVDIAVHRAELFGATEDFLVTREFVDASTPDQRVELLDCVFAVAASDASISGIEDHAIERIARELEFTHEDFVRLRAKYSDWRTVLRDLPDAPPRRDA